MSSEPPVVGVVAACMLTNATGVIQKPEFHYHQLSDQMQSGRAVESGMNELCMKEYTNANITVSRENVTASPSRYRLVVGVK